MFRNSIYLMATTIITSLLGYLCWALAAHLYAPRQIGVASALIAALMFASNLSSIGLGATLIERLPRCTTDQGWSGVLTAALIVGLVGGLVAGLAIALALPSLSPQLALLRESGATVLFVLGVPLWTQAGLLDAVFVAHRAAGNVLIRNGTFSLLKIPLTVAPALAGQGSALGITLSWVAASGLTAGGAALVLLPRLGRVYRPTMRHFHAEARVLCRSFAGHHCIGLGGMAWMYLMPSLVIVRLSAADNAYASVTWMTGSFFFMISAAVSTALFAEGAHTAASLATTARSSIVLIGALLAPALLVCAAAGTRILAVFGPAYAQHGAGLLAILAIAAVPDAVTNLYVMVLRVQGRLAHAALLNLGMATLSLMLAWILTPRLGIAGTGWSWLAGQGAGTVAVGAHLLCVRRARPARESASSPTSAARRGKDVHHRGTEAQRTRGGSRKHMAHPERYGQ